MSRITAEDIRTFLLNRFEAQLQGKGLSLAGVPDDFDLLTEGVVDSAGMVELVVALERRFAVRLDFDELEPENLTVVGPLCRYIELRSSEPLMTM